MAVACSRLSLSEDDRKGERATSGISGERDPGEKIPYQTPLVALPPFQSLSLTESLQQAKMADEANVRLESKITLARRELNNLRSDVYSMKKMFAQKFKEIKEMVETGELLLSTINNWLKKDKSRET